MPSNPPDPRNKPAPAPKLDIASEEEELVHYDDRVIGRAFRSSAVALLILVAGAGAVIYWLNRKQAERPAQVTRLTAPVTKEVPVSEIPAARFTDITEPAGIHFIHHNGAY